jgi:hypothetical protein
MLVIDMKSVESLGINAHIEKIGGLINMSRNN